MEDFYSFARSAWVVWMMGLFLVIVAWALWPSNREKFRRAARIPLNEQELPPHKEAARGKKKGSGRDLANNTNHRA